MARCGNCGVTMTCSCQKRTASDGKVGCAKCIPAYQKTLKQKTSSENLKKFTDNGSTPGIVSVNVY